MGSLFLCPAQYMCLERKPIGRSLTSERLYGTMFLPFFLKKLYGTMFLCSKKNCFTVRFLTSAKQSHRDSHIL